MEDDQTKQKQNSLSQLIDYQQVLDKDILDLLGLNELSLEKKREMYSLMIGTIENRVLIRLMDDLSDQEIEEFNALMESGDRTGALKYLEDRNIDLPRYYIEESLIHKTELLALLKKSQIKKEE